MHVTNLKHHCGHWQEWMFSCGYRAAESFVAALAALECPRCAARHTAGRIRDDLMREYHQTLCCKQQPPDTVPLFMPGPRRRRAV